MYIKNQEILLNNKKILKNKRISSPQPMKNLSSKFIGKYGHCFSIIGYIKHNKKIITVMLSNIGYWIEYPVQ